MRLVYVLNMSSSLNKDIIIIIITIIIIIIIIIKYLFLAFGLGSSFLWVDRDPGELLRWVCVS